MKKRQKVTKSDICAALETAIAIVIERSGRDISGISLHREGENRWVALLPFGEDGRYEGASLQSAVEQLLIGAAENAKNEQQVKTLDNALRCDACGKVH